MSKEFIKRTIISRIGGSAENRSYVDAVGKYLIDLEASTGKEITFINHIKNDCIPFGFDETETYEVYDWIDPFKDEKKKPKDYKPPEIKHRLMEDVGEGGEGWHFHMPTFNFDILWFCVLAVFIGLVIFGFIFFWYVITLH